MENIEKRVEDPNQCKINALASCKYTRGEHDPVNANKRVVNGKTVDNPAGRAVNRRVDLIRTDDVVRSNGLGVLVAHGRHPGEKTKDFAETSLRKKM